MQTIHLQSIGKQWAVPAKDLTPGVKLCWNYSYGEYEVVKVVEISPKFVMLTERNIKTGVESDRRCGKDRLIGIVVPKGQLV